MATLPCWLSEPTMFPRRRISVVWMAPWNSSGPSTTTFMTGSSTTGGDPSSCLFEWRDQSGASACLDETQGDHLECIQILDCWLENDCGPNDSCTSSAATGECHPNTLGVGGGGYPYAESVFNALCG